MLSINRPVIAQVDRASFTIWSKDDIKKISVKRITDLKTFDKGSSINPDGLYSPALGPCKRFEMCTTCGLSSFNCPGHYGHIELPVPVYHPMLIQVLYQLLSKFCFECHHFRLPQSSLKLFLAQLDALNNGFDHLIDELDEIAADMTRDNNKGKVDDSYIHVVVGKKLESRIREEKEKNPDFDCQKRPQQRSIVDRLYKLFRNFIGGYLIKPSKICPNCSTKKVSVFLHHQSVILLGANSKSIDDLSKLNTDSGKKNKRKSKVHDEAGDIDLNFLHVNDKKFLTPIGARYYLKKLWDNERRFMKGLFHFLDIGDNSKKEELKQDDEDDPKEQLKRREQFHPIDLFFIDTILVPPCKFRPPMSQRGYCFEGPRTGALSNVMKMAIVVQDFREQVINEPNESEATKLHQKLQTSWKNLQTAINIIFDNEMDRYGKEKYPGLKQLIDKKEGLFRKNMMGKRVNFAARSVISPDPNISVDQIGVPMVFAKRLTYPEPVTPMNIKQLKQAILNGPDKYPGAQSIVYDDGMTVSLYKESVRQNCASRLSYNPKFNRSSNKDSPLATTINRHLLSGDVLLFNRQPTLHKPSIMAFRARVLPNEKGFRLHYANCKSFNADFDGDEMNAHLPQSELARSEAYNIASVNHQYLVPKDGSPLGGLIQDHVVAVCILTGADEFLNKGLYDQLVYCSIAFLEKPIVHEPPAIIKPVQLWTGKQVITTIIKNCIPEGRKPPNLKIKSKVSAKILGIDPKDEEFSDCHVLIRDGELLKGLMDKTNVGATQYGLIHICYELYGGETSSNLMSAFARLATIHLQMYQGFTLGIGDILVDDEANLDRTELIKESRTLGDDSAKEALEIKGYLTEQQLENKLREAHSDRNPLAMKKLDASMKLRTDKVTSSISGRCLPDGLIRRFPDNNLQMMIQTGAKGGTVNALQISCLLGQIELEGRRVPLSMSGRSLPSFKPYDTSPKAGGFVTGRFLTGIQPQEFFFHCMAGREGLIDTAVKTSRSGYLQRCLIKHLEGITVHYDQTVRDSCGSVIQFLYGEDGLDIVKSQMLKEKAFASLIDNYNIIKPTQEETDKLNEAREGYEEEVIARTDAIQQWLNQNGESRIRQVRGSGFLDFLAAQAAIDNSEEGKEEEEYQMDTEPEASGREDEPSKWIGEPSEIDKPKESMDSNESATKLKLASSRQVNSHLHEKLFGAWYALSFKEKRKWNKFWEACPDPLTALMNPGSHFGVVPERLDEMIERFLRDNSKLTKHEFYNLCYILYMKMLAQPGEAVGLLAAQSIGEPSTQMTLNTFHFAGRGEMNVTLGIPRLREILMTASAKIGTPSMDLPALKVMLDDDGNELNEMEMEKQVTRIKLALNAVRLSDVLEYVDLTEEIINLDAATLTDSIEGVGTTSAKKRRSSSGKKVAIGHRHPDCQAVKYEIKFAILPSKFYKHEFQSNSSKVIKFIEGTFIDHLIDAMIRRQKRLQMADDMFDITKRTRVSVNNEAPNEGTVSPDGEDQEENELDDYNAKAEAREKQAKEDDSSSEEDDDFDGDNTTEKLKNRRNQDLDYEEPEEDDLNVGDMEAKAAEIDENDADILADDERRVPAEDDVEVVEQHHTATKVVNESQKKRIDLIKTKPFVMDYEFDTRRERWCKLTIALDMTTTRLDMSSLIETEARKTFVHRVGNIQRALIVKDVNAKSRGAKCEKMIKTEGVSLLSLVRFNHILDLNAIYTNDIHAIANTYGIEAASRAIRREMANVFAVYGIEVDSRHLSLIADYMTYSGSIRGMNRMSMEASASPFQQMSFESTLRYLKWSSILGLHDDIKSPSASLVFGRPTRGGTGIFSLLTNPKEQPRVRKDRMTQEKMDVTNETPIESWD